MADETLGRFVAGELARKGMSQTDLVKTSGLDKNTVSAIVNDRVKNPSPKTLGKVEQALGLTPGTLVEFGEDPNRGAPDAMIRSLDGIPAQRLAVALAEQVANMNETIAEWWDPAQRYERRHWATYEFATEHEREDGLVGELSRRLTQFDVIETQRKLRDAEERELDEVVLGLDAARWIEAHPDAIAQLAIGSSGSASAIPTSLLSMHSILSSERAEKSSEPTDGGGVTPIRPAGWSPEWADMPDAARRSRHKPRPHRVEDENQDPGE